MKKTVHALVATQFEFETAESLRAADDCIGLGR